MMKHKLAFVVPTMDRPEDLRRMLASLSTQTRPADQVIIVDASQPDVRTVCEEFISLPLDYVREYPPSLAKQRNAGMGALRPEITLAGYLDDDIVLDPDAVERMLLFWEAAPPEFGGAAFNITNALPSNWIQLKNLFLIDSPQAGRLLSSGFPSTIGFQKHNLDADWLYGGATVWRREIVDQFNYDEWFLGTGFMEDVDFSYSVRKSYRLMVVAGARLAHYSYPVKLEREALLGKWQIVNRMYIVRKHRSRGLSLVAAWVASIGITVLNAAIALLRMRKNYWLRARGNISGMFTELMGKRSSLGGHLK